MPEISIVLPTYNRAEEIGRTIESVLGQDFADFELIVVDDGSVDDTAAAVAAHDDERVVYVAQERNMGGNAARNRGIREARGAIVCFLDSDDEYLPHKLATVKAFFDRHSDIDVLIDSFEYVPECRGSQDRTTTLRLNPDLTGSTEIERRIFARMLWKPTPSISARRDALFKVGLFDEGLRRRQDMDLALRLARQCRCAATSAVLWRKHWTEGAISSTTRTFVDAVIDICDRHPDYVRKAHFRVGLERDLARHCLRLIARGEPSMLMRDLKRIARYFGAGETVRFIAGGVVELAKRLLPWSGSRGPEPAGK
ncbi:glycosyltransferase family 2 protein [Kaustia mangrovi]|uniref:Glycosyltransferase family 2 protein n=1 Tax=Kaustia mangrovi TaxID=2593653 RepID=A0A7S8C5S6_9HYPH|nr:glycosyltransferase family A protein [Kaustia mangrovi]QPC43908.1 glycosyltransferase family 2 protein [Kaustia mangrovi]